MPFKRFAGLPAEAGFFFARGFFTTPRASPRALTRGLTTLFAFFTRALFRVPFPLARDEVVLVRALFFGAAFLAAFREAGFPPLRDGDFPLLRDTDVFLAMVAG